MRMNLIKNEFLEAQKVLEEFISSEINFEKIAHASDLIVEAFNNGNKIISCGNGGSMCDAMHFAEELSGRFRENRPALAAMAISDSSYISCVANDYGYDQVFSRYLEAFGKQNDVLLAISTSGNSKTVINAIQVAKSKGMKVIGLTGKDGGKMASLCDVEIRAPHSKYADRAQEIHIKVIHSIILTVEQQLFTS
ncbi:MAG: D-sedoheptulose 7-phosphate isomerase [Bacteroidetes bacterium]|nr:D-sedoheptulose 7-phosphate isomerase [Bacteroidota bacterium]